MRSEAEILRYRDGFRSRFLDARLMRLRRDVAHQAPV